jgi:[ribosomal protein S18]-alanine N-acetyltransferase
MEPTKAPEFLRLDIKHLDRVLEIEKLSFKKPWSRWNFEREINLNLSTFVVAVIDNNIIGYGGFWKILDEGHIVNLAVHPDFRLKGYGRLILDYLMQKITETGIKRTLLEVRQSNYYAIKLYSSFGFKITGIRPKYYDQEDAFVMEKLLTEESLTV